MSNTRMEISIIDFDWPRLKIVITRQGKVTQSTAMYDIAASQFEPAVKDALRQLVEDILRSHKK